MLVLGDNELTRYFGSGVRPGRHRHHHVRLIQVVKRNHHSEY